MRVEWVGWLTLIIIFLSQPTINTMPAKIHIGGRTVSAVPWRTKGHAAGVSVGGALLENPGGGGGQGGSEQCERTAGRAVMGSGLSARLSSLVVAPINRKPKNIKFEM